MSYARYPSLLDKVVFITGGGSGIGAAMVEAFVAQKANVAFVDVQTEPSRALAARLGASGPAPLFIGCDLTDIAALEAAMEEVRQRLGPIAVLINNAANDQREDADEVSEEDWDQAMALNVKHQFFAAQIARRSMRELGGGAIVNFSSTAWMLGISRLSLYSAAKAAVVGLTKSLARVRPRQYPRQRHRPRRGADRASAALVAQRAGHRRFSRPPMPRPQPGGGRRRATGAVSVRRRQRHDHQAVLSGRRRPPLTGGRPNTVDKMDLIPG